MFTAGCDSVLTSPGGRLSKQTAVIRVIIRTVDGIALFAASGTTDTRERVSGRTNVRQTTNACYIAKKNRFTLYVSSSPFFRDIMYSVYSD